MHENNDLRELHAAYVEVEGWTTDGDYVSDSDRPRDGETRPACLARIIARSGIVEIGQASDEPDEPVVRDPAAWQRVAAEGRRFA